ncbi:MAG: hypothetical protein GC162_03885 [Planctomycetes bacterium]|nr:hypothetical protein [Planctomycetota bacterium]
MLRGQSMMIVLGIVSVAMAGCQQPAAQADDAKAPEAPAAAAVKPVSMPFVDVNLKEGYVDVAGSVCLREGPLELFATVASGKEHESIITIKARPQNVHFALLMLGAKPGSPGSWEYKDNKPIPHDPKGDHLKLTLLYDKDGKKVERPINEFVRDMKTRKTLASNVFVFAGSRMTKDENGKESYAADSTGDVVTLVSFYEEMIAQPKAASNSNEQLEWEANTPEIPEVGTPVTLRIYFDREAAEPKKK